jgi:hypothetical protein
VTDTGSMTPSPEAQEWAERAEAWAQRTEGGGEGQLEVSRWSSVAPTGRPSFPAEGVGWRTETAEWRAAEQTARWRQTTEWRSASGTHGWRSTTEAWHTGAGAENLIPPTTEPTGRQPLAISGTAWVTPGTETPGAEVQEPAPGWQPTEDSGTLHTPDGRVSWQRFTDGTPPWEAGNGSRPGEAGGSGNGGRPWEAGGPGNGGRPWESGGSDPGGTPSWQQPNGSTVEPSDARPAWQQFAAPTTGPSWAQPAAGWSGPSTNGRRSAEPDRAESSWQQFVDPASRSRAEPDQRPAWQSSAEPDPYRGAPDDGRHLVREDDRARWRRESGAGMAGPGEGTRQIGRRRAPEGDGRPSGGTGWSTRSDADNWAGHADTGSIQMFGDADSGGSWGARSEAPSWRDDARSGTEWRGRTDSWRAEPDSGSWSRDDEARTDNGRRWQDTPGWQRETPDEPGGTTGRRARRREIEPPADPWAQSAADTGVIPMAWQQPETDTGSWRTETGTGFVRPTNPNRRRDDGGTRGGRRRAADDETVDPAVWRREGQAGAVPGNWPEDEPRRRRAEDDEPRPGRRGGPLAIEGPRGNRDEADPRGAARRGHWADEPGGGQWADEPGGGRRAAGYAEDGRAVGWAGEQRGAGRAAGWADDDGRGGGRAAGWVDDGRAAGWADDGRDGPRTAGWADDERGDPRTPGYGPNGRGGARAAGWADDEARGAGAAGWAEGGGRAAGYAEGGARAAGWADDEPRRAVRWDAEPPREIEPPRAANWTGAEPAQDWRRDMRDDPPPGDAVTEVRPLVDPEGWQGPEARGKARYRASGSDDWRRELAAQSGDLAEGESRRFGTQEFVPFRPSGSAAVPTSAPAAPPVERPVNGARPELLVPNTTGSRPAPEQSPEQWPPRRPTGYQSPVAGGSYERRPVSTDLSAAPNRPNNLLDPDDDDDLEEEPGGPLAAVGYTAMWYGVPVVLVVLYMLVLNGSQQATALDTLAGAAPEFFLSLLLSMVVAVGLRWASGTWKAASVGLAAAVMGGGLATVLSSAITGNSLS